MGSACLVDGGDRWACPWNVTGKEGLTLFAANHVDEELALDDDPVLPLPAEAGLLAAALRSVSTFLPGREGTPSRQ